MSPESLPYIGLIDNVTTAEYRRAIDYLNEFTQRKPQPINNVTELNRALGEVGPSLRAIGITKGEKHRSEPRYTYTQKFWGRTAVIEVTPDFVELSVATSRTDKEYTEGLKDHRRGYGVRLLTNRQEDLEITPALEHIYAYEDSGRNTMKLRPYSINYSGNEYHEFFTMTQRCVGELMKKDPPQPQTVPPTYSR